MDSFVGFSGFGGFDVFSGFGSFAGFSGFGGFGGFSDGGCGGKRSQDCVDSHSARALYGDVHQFVGCVWIDERAWSHRKSHYPGLSWETMWVLCVFLHKTEQRDRGVRCSVFVCGFFQRSSHAAQARIVQSWVEAGDV